MSAIHSLGHARTFDSLRRHHNYRVWFLAQIISTTGTWVQNVAQAWLIVQLTHSSPLALGALALCTFGPFFAVGLFGGVLADRMDNRTALYITQGSFMVSAVLLATLTLLGVVNVAEVYVLAVVNGLTQVLDVPARQAFTIQLVGRSELPNAIALNSSMFNASRVLGPAIGGLIIAHLGVGLCFVINAVSFVAVLIALTLLRVADLFPVGKAKRGPVLTSVGEGLRFSWRHAQVRLALLLVLVVATVGVNFNVLLPLLASQTLHAGADVFGWLSAFFGGGALVGALISASLGRASWRVVLGAGAVFSVGELALAPLGGFLACGIALAFIGVGFSLFASNCNAIIQLTTPDPLRGRVLSVYGYVFFGTAPFGGLLMGWLADVGGTGLAFGIAGGVSLAAVLVAALAADLTMRPVSTLRRRLGRQQVTVAVEDRAGLRG